MPRAIPSASTLARLERERSRLQPKTHCRKTPPLVPARASETTSIQPCSSLADGIISFAGFRLPSGTGKASKLSGENKDGKEGVSERGRGLGGGRFVKGSLC